MTDNKSTNSEKNLRLMEMRRTAQQYSYDLTQKLSFFIISIELIFCGYILLNFEKLGVIKFSSLLFLLSGAAAIFGLVWRFCYNQNQHDAAHDKRSGKFKLLNWIQNFSYWICVALTIAFFLGIVIIGYEHIKQVERGNIKIKNNIQILNDRINGIENSLNKISISIEKLAEIEPRVEVILLPPDGKDKSIKKPKNQTE